MTLDEAHCIDAELQPNLGGILASHGYNTFTEPVVAQMRQTDLPQWFPQAQIQDGPVVILCLPNAMTRDVQSLATSPLFPVNDISSDIGEEITSVLLVGGALEIHINADKIKQSRDTANVGGLHLILVCDNQFLIIKHSLSSDWDRNIGHAMMMDVFNYRPDQRRTTAEIGEVAEETPATHVLDGVSRQVWYPEVFFRSRAKLS
ncbi:hypothetical protein BZG29_02155 [Janthinobacterium sp. LM6]|nr:hypothetical protein BZG29_02155 [Janthinobacterium sp. LM6]